MYVCVQCVKGSASSEDKVRRHRKVVRKIVHRMIDWDKTVIATSVPVRRHNPVLTLAAAAPPPQDGGAGDGREGGRAVAEDEGPAFRTLIRLSSSEEVRRHFFGKHAPRSSVSNSDSQTNNQSASTASGGAPSADSAAVGAGSGGDKEADLLPRPHPSAATTPTANTSTPATASASDATTAAPPRNSSGALDDVASHHLPPDLNPSVDVAAAARNPTTNMVPPSVVSGDVNTTVASTGSSISDGISSSGSDNNPVAQGDNAEGRREALKGAGAVSRALHAMRSTPLMIHAFQPAAGGRHQQQLPPIASASAAAPLPLESDTPGSPTSTSPPRSRFSSSLATVSPSASGPVEGAGGPIALAHAASFGGGVLGASASVGGGLLARPGLSTPSFSSPSLSTQMQNSNRAASGTGAVLPSAATGVSGFSRHYGMAFEDEPHPPARALGAAPTVDVTSRLSGQITGLAFGSPSSAGRYGASSISPTATSPGLARLGIGAGGSADGSPISSAPVAGGLASPPGSVLAALAGDEDDRDLRSFSQRSPGRIADTAALSTLSSPPTSSSNAPPTHTPTATTPPPSAAALGASLTPLLPPGRISRFSSSRKLDFSAPSVASPTPVPQLGAVSILASSPSTGTGGLPVAGLGSGQSSASKGVSFATSGPSVVSSASASVSAALPASHGPRGDADSYLDDGLEVEQLV